TSTCLAIWSISASAASPAVWSNQMVTRLAPASANASMAVRLLNCPEKPKARISETVVKTPGLSSPCTMECGEGVLTAFGLGFTPHIQGQAGTDLRLRPHPVDTLLHLAIAPVAPLHRIRGGGRQFVVREGQGLSQR